MIIFLLTILNLAMGLTIYINPCNHLKYNTRLTIANVVRDVQVLNIRTIYAYDGYIICNTKGNTYSDGVGIYVNENSETLYNELLGYLTSIILSRG